MLKYKKFSRAEGHNFKIQKMPLSVHSLLNKKDKQLDTSLWALEIGKKSKRKKKNLKKVKRK